MQFGPGHKLELSDTTNDRPDIQLFPGRNSRDTTEVLDLEMTERGGVLGKELDEKAENVLRDERK